MSTYYVSPKGNGRASIVASSDPDRLGRLVSFVGVHCSERLGQLFAEDRDQPGSLGRSELNGAGTPLVFPEAQDEKSLFLVPRYAQLPTPSIAEKHPRLPQAMKLAHLRTLPIRSQSARA